MNQIVKAFVLILGLVSAQNPGFRVLLTNQGLDEIRKVGIPILVQELQGLTIPDISGSADTPVGHIDYTLSNIKAKSVSLPTSKVVSTTSGIAFSITGASVGLGCDWHYREHSWPHVSDHGSADVTASSLNAAVTVDIGMSATHEPTVSTASCSASIGHLDIHFHGGASWLYNIFSSLIADTFKKSLNKELCQIITQEINTQGNKALAGLPEVETLDQYTEIDFSLIKPPALTAEYVETAHKGEFLWRAHNTSHSPFTPEPIPAPSSSTPRMLYAYISAYTAETAGWAYQQAGVLDYNFTNSQIPSDFPLKLNTSFFKDIIPGLYKLCPNCAMQADLAALNPPVAVHIDSSGLNATITANITAVVLPKGAAPQAAFTLKVNIDVAGKVAVVANGTQELVTANLTLLRIGLSLSSSSVGQFSVKPLQSLVNLFVTEFFLPDINKAIAKGFPIPSVEGVTFVNPQVGYGPDYVIISTDINYKPSFLLEKLQTTKKSKHHSRKFSKPNRNLQKLSQEA